MTAQPASPIRWIKSRIRARATRVLDRRGWHLAKKDFYSSLPDYAWLKEHPESWQEPASMIGVEWDLGSQLKWLSEFCREPYIREARLDRLEQEIPAAAGLGYGEIEAQILHCFTRFHRPPNILEVGGGYSTAVMVRAMKLNHEEKPYQHQITTVEPFPAPELLSMTGVTVVHDYAQLVKPSLFESLVAGDLLFIDSTHTVKTGSELIRLYLQVIPSLPSGIYLHIHDIYLPFLYGRLFSRDSYDWQETTLLLALLTDNPRLKVLACTSALHYERAAELKEILPEYRPQKNLKGLQDPSDFAGHFPASCWLVTS